MPEAIAAAVAIGLRVVPIRKGRRSYVRVSSPTDEGRDFAAGGFVPYVRAAVERYRATGKIGVIRNISYRIDSGYGRGARA